MEYKETIWCQDASVFPSWKEPCPFCGGKINTRKDNTGAWCNKCGQNWKISGRKTGSQKPKDSEAMDLLRQIDKNVRDIKDYFTKQP
jgi:ribosomal protein L37AE/L43A